MDDNPYQAPQGERDESVGSFFGVPPGVRLWAQVGPRFWGGMLIGVGFGFFLGANLIKEGVISSWPGTRIVGITLVLMWIGMWIALRSVRRSAQQQ
jgi:hypothetical protein